MTTQPPASDAQTAAAALLWLAEMGDDEPMEATPQDRFAAPAPAPALLTSPAPSIAPPPTATKRAQAAQPSGDALAAREIASQAQDIAALRAALDGFDGCALKATATTLVFADGAAHAPLMIVGEAPGAEEDRTGTPFVGAAGQLPDKMLAAIGRDRTTTYITNILPWRPPGNRTPTTAEIELLRPFVERHIALAAPKALLFLGGVAAKTLFDTADGITKLRGRWRPWGADEIPAMATFHPAFLLRQPARKREVWRDLLAVKRALEAPG
ncbi:MAG: uracil-DNA glycosylase [Pseudomonadota bacterium]